jgi:arabinose operon protein AraL
MLINDRIQGYLIDLDGTIFTGNQPIDGAAKAIQFLRDENKKLVFLSNRGNISRQMCLKKLKNAGIEASEEEIILTSFVAAQFLRKNYLQSKVWVLGEQGLTDELRLADVRLANKPEEADWLLISLHETVTYNDLNDAFKAARHGARIIATNADKTFPNEDGNAIDVAGMIGAIEATTERRAEIIVGKPSWLMAEAALDQLGLQAEECMVIGDSLESDIALGKMFGMQTLLVLSGSTKGEAVSFHRYKPDYVLESIVSLKTLLKEEI